MSSYPYAPPPPPPTTSTAPAGQYQSYNQPHSYNTAPHRGGQHPYGGGGRGRGQHDYASSSRYYPQQPDYAPSPPGGHYSTPQASAHWQSAPAVAHYPPPQQSVPHHASPAYPASYGAQAYSSAAGQGYQPPYPNAPARPSPGPPYSAYPNDHPSQRWSEQGPAFPPYPSRGGRGAFQSDRGGHKSENSMVPPTTMRLGFEHNNDRVAHASSPYGSPYQPNAPPGPYVQPPYTYSPVPDNQYSAPTYTSHGTHGFGNRGGSGRDGFSHSNRGGRGGHSSRGEKFRHRDQKSSHGFNPSQKPDAAVHSKKKKRRINTLGLTPGDESSEGEGMLDDEEKRLSELLGADAPVIPDMAAWIAERKANYPTKARIEAKKAALADSTPKADDSSKPAVSKIDKEQAKIDKLEKKLSKLKGVIEKRKRAANDEGDEMRADESPDSSNSSDDEEPEVQSSSKPATTFLPPPPITRADPSNHCKYYSTGGTCGKKGKCRFKHDPAVREAALQERTRNGGRMTLKQRLLLNDKDHEDMDVVKAIVEMRSSGRLVDPQNLQVRVKQEEEEQTVPSAGPSTLPTTAGVASLPPNPYAPKKPAPHKT